jgi:hypothetical protein
VNRLGAATSPYLLQHKDNPVDWLEWSPEAFEEARRRDVSVLLFVGYSSCHWCHVAEPRSLSAKLRPRKSPSQKAHSGHWGLRRTPMDTDSGASCITFVYHPEWS